MEREPLVPALRPAAVDDAVHARALVRRALKSVYGRGESAAVAASEGELNGLMSFIAQGADRFSGRVEVTPGGLLTAMTLRLSPTPAGGYLNLRVDVLPSGEGLRIGRVRLGRLAIPGPAALFFLRRLLDLGMGAGEGAAVLASVRAVSLSGDSVHFQLQSLPRLRESLKRLKGRAAALRDEVAFFGALPADPQAVRLYQDRLRQVDRPGEAVSLAVYLEPLFRLARERSADGDAVAENRAALLALSIHLGDKRFAHLVGPADPERKRRPAPKALLAGRRDLRLHFVVSAGLKLMADQGTGFAVGEMKELLDTGRGGSGFSFIDLAADRAGVRFAEAATTAAGARRIQRLMAGGAREELFFPPVADLPENLSQAEFEGRFGHIGSAAYQAMVREIDARLDRCPAYAPS